MIIATLLVAILVMAIMPSRDELARELAERNDRCGYCADGFVCLRPKNHQNEHDKEPIERTVPFA